MRAPKSLRFALFVVLCWVIALIGAAIGVSALMATPAAAQSYFFSSAGSGSNANNNDDYVVLTAAGDGHGQSITNGAANVVGSWIPVGTAPFDLCELIVEVGEAPTSTSRVQFEISFDNSTVKHPTVYVQPGGKAWGVAPIPLKVPSGTTVYIRTRVSSSGAEVRFNVIGVKASASRPAGFDNAVSITTPDTTATRASNDAQLTLRTSTGTYDTIKASLGATYGALLVGMGEASTAPSAPATVRMVVANGSSNPGSDVRTVMHYVQSGGPAVRSFPTLIRRTFASGSWLGANLLAAAAGAPGPDIFWAYAIGYY